LPPAGEPPDQRGGGQEPTRDVGDHGVGERELATVDRPRRLQRGGGVAVAAAAECGGLGRAGLEAAGVLAADEAPEDRRRVDVSIDEPAAKSVVEGGVG
jgi:hypothetical protein